MESTPRKRGRPKLCLTKEMVEERRALKRMRNNTRRGLGSAPEVCGGVPTLTDGGTSQGGSTDSAALCENNSRFDAEGTGGFSCSAAPRDDHVQSDAEAQGPSDGSAAPRGNHGQLIVEGTCTAFVDFIQLPINGIITFSQPDD